MRVEPNFFAPGDWSKAGTAVNLVNVKGATADLKFDVTDNIRLYGNAMFLEPEDIAADTRARLAIFQNGRPSVWGNILDKLTAWKAGLKYGINSKTSLDLGFEQVTWDPNFVGDSDKERYYTIGFGHSFNPNSKLKLMYQVTDYDDGALAPYGVGACGGGIATAQFMLKY